MMMIWKLKTGGFNFLALEIIFCHSIYQQVPKTKQKIGAEYI